MSPYTSRQQKRSALIKLMAVVVLAVMLVGCDGRRTPTPKSPSNPAEPRASTAVEPATPER